MFNPLIPIPPLTPLPPNIILTLATIDDVPSIAHNGHLGFLNDTNTQVKALWRGETWLEDGVQEGLASQIANDKYRCIVARDISINHDVVEGSFGKGNGKGKVVGWVSFAKVGYKPSTSTPANEEDPIPIPTSTPPPPPPPTHPTLPTSTPLTADDLESLTSANMSEWVAHLIPPGTRCQFVAGLNVHPEYQGQGIARALLRYGTKQCDDHQVFCWVPSSMSAQPAYEKAGFKEVGRLELNLDVFANGVKREGYQGEDGLGWGWYVWPQMIREPEVGGMSERTE